MMAALSLRFLYIHCADLETMRRFYTDLLGLTESFYAAGRGGALAYACDELQFTIFPAESAEPAPVEWHRQPGWEGGTLPGISWSIVAESREAFAASVARLVAADVPAFFETPRWLGYWSFPVKDPMGNTVELTLPTESEPPDRVWA
jgi:catechol 2,3-dioxygenase-like lactoylglutathione lyase family enzyme